MPSPRCLAGLVVLLAVASTAYAVAPSEAFSSFGPGNSYTTTVGWGITGASTSGGYRGQAEWFRPAFSGNLFSIDLAMFLQSGSGRINYTLTADNGAGPGQILESFSNVVTPTGISTLHSLNAPLLQAGEKYWLTAEPANSTVVNAWFDNNQGRAVGFAFERAPNAWMVVADPNPDAVFRVSLIVPEPSAAAFLLLSLLAVMWWQKAMPRLKHLQRRAPWFVYSLRAGVASESAFIPVP